jgi:hypothetical protein
MEVTNHKPPWEPRGFYVASYSIKGVLIEQYSWSLRVKIKTLLIHSSEMKKKIMTKCK